jgi:hypothetical protein
MKALALLSLFLAAPVAAAPALWGGLEPGPHAVGFRQIERLDPARPFWTPRTLDGRPRERERARPVRISVWYPATAAPGPALTVGDYVALMGVEDRLGPVTPPLAEAGRRAFFAFQLLRDLDDAQRKKALALPGIARAGAPARKGRFPLIVYSLGSAAVGHVTPEYLASHGYIVAQAPRLGAYAGLPPDNRDQLDLVTKLGDMDEVIRAMAAVPEADVTHMATIGFSAGGRWALHTAMKNPQVRAVISLDSVMLFGDGLGRLWKAVPGFDLEAVRVPVLHLVRADFASQEDPKMWAAMRHADRTVLRFDDPALDHLDFQSIGLVHTLAGGRPDKAKTVRAAFDLWNRTSLAFLDAHLRDRDEARKQLAAVAPGPQLAVTRAPAEPAAMTSADFWSGLAEEGPDSAAAALRRATRAAGRPPVREGDLILAGYVNLFGARPKESLLFFDLAAELYPRSANVEDSLGDAHLALGDRGKAREHTEAAQ